MCFVKFKPRESFTARRPPKINNLFHRVKYPKLSRDETALTPLPHTSTNDGSKALNFKKRSARYAISADAANFVTDLPGRGLTFSPRRICASHTIVSMDRKGRDLSHEVYAQFFSDQKKMLALETDQSYDKEDGRKC